MTERVVVDTMTRWSRVVHVIIRMIVLLLAKLLFRMEVRNAERLPMAGAYIIAPVHRSNLDAFIAVSAVPPRTVVRTVAKDTLWQAAWFGRFLEKMGSVPVHREGVDRTALRRSSDALTHGQPLLMFPEGTRRSGPVVDEVLEGPAWLALRTGVPVVPMGIHGSEKAMPRGAKFIRPTKVIVDIGEPLIPDLPTSGRVRQANVVELTDEIRRAVQLQYDRARGVAR